MSITDRARRLRREATPAEEVLWNALRGRKLGYRIKRQCPLVYQQGTTLYTFIVDFYCPEKGVAIELDGPIHATQQAEDQLRTEIINQQGIRVVRFTNRQVLDRLAEVIRQLQDELR